MRVEAVLFDLFDTLLMIEGGEAFYMPSLMKLHESLVKNGVRVSFEDFRDVYFEVRDRLYAQANKTLEEPHFNVRISLTLKRLGYKYDASDAVVTGATEAFAGEFLQYLRLEEDTINVLQKLREKYKLGIVSNFAIPECVRKLLEKFDLNKLFDAIVISGEVNKRKPSPEIFEKALKALNIDASQAVFVGDTPHLDIKGAKSVGIKAILIERKASATDTPNKFVWRSPDEKEPIKPDKVIKRLRELPIVLEELQ